jgi:murein DD-endopeptidase
MLFEPLAVKRQVKVTQTRTKVDFAQCLKDLSDTFYPKADTIILVMDNLNTHSLASLYTAFLPAEARRLVERFEKMSEAEKFIYALLFQFGSPYKWGEENPEGADCSGSVCLALFMATGFLVRTTADDLFHRFFTVNDPKAGSIQAAFFVDGKTKIAAHVARFVGEGIVLNAQEQGAEVKRVKELTDWFSIRGTYTVIRGLDRNGFERLAEKGNRYGIDYQLKRYF